MERNIITLEVRNWSSRARTVKLAKFAGLENIIGPPFKSRNAQTLKFKLNLLHNEEPCRAYINLLQSEYVTLLEGLTSDKTKTSAGLIIF